MDWRAVLGDAMKRAGALGGRGRRNGLVEIYRSDEWKKRTAQTRRYRPVGKYTRNEEKKRESDMYVHTHKMEQVVKESYKKKDNTNGNVSKFILNDTVSTTKDVWHRIG